MLSGAFYSISWASPQHFFLKKLDSHDTVRDLWGFVKFWILRLHQMTCFPFYTGLMDLSPGFFKTKEHINYYSWFTNNSGSHSFRVGGLQPQTNERMFKVALHTCFCRETKVKTNKQKLKKKKKKKEFGRGFPYGRSAQF